MMEATAASADSPGTLLEHVPPAPAVSEASTPDRLTQTSRTTATQ
ncbi:hypothetical protein PI125_g20684 [Phytophthora idaei]|nr:hypothetical protein PI125_g20684 [Phytophthora idaei]